MPPALLRPDGVVLGQYSQSYLRPDGPEHVLCFAPARSGKGVGLVVPTLLPWPGSCIVHVLYAEPDKTLAGVANFLSDPRRPVEATLRAMMDTPHLGEAGVHPVIASSARELLVKSENERSGVLSTAMSFLGLYRDSVVARVSRSSEV